MIPIRTIVRDVISTKLLSAHDKLTDFAHGIESHEMDIAQRIRRALPTPAKALHKVSNILFHAGMACSPNCEECNCWPCDCGRARERNEYSYARRTWLTYDITDALDELIEDVGPEGLNLVLARKYFETSPSTEYAAAYRAVAWYCYKENDVTDHPLTLSELCDVFIQTQEWVQ